MTDRAFIVWLGGVLAAGLVLAGLLRLGLGARAYGFYGWATVALATAGVVTVLLWQRLPHVGMSRWWSLLVAVPAAVAAFVQIGFWAMFFRTGGSNPTLGVAREMVRPWLEPGFPVMVAVWLVVVAWLIVRAGRTRLG
jgi:uncharacterized membrane protein